MKRREERKRATREQKQEPNRNTSIQKGQIIFKVVLVAYQHVDVEKEMQHKNKRRFSYLRGKQAIKQLIILTMEMISYVFI